MMALVCSLQLEYVVEVKTEIFCAQLYTFRSIHMVTTSEVADTYTSRLNGGFFGTKL